MINEARILNAKPEDIAGLLRENVQLSANFRLGEFLVSQTAQRRGIDNTPNVDQLRCLYLLAKNVVQPIRELIAVPTRVSSGLRVPALNTAIGGSKNSQHIRGQAADLIPVGDKSLVQYAEMIAKSDIQFDQLILEFHNLAIPSSGWLHVAYNPDRAKQRRQVLTIDSKGTRVGIDPR